MILEFVALDEKNKAVGERLQAYHYPAKNNYDPPINNLVIYDPDLISNFV